MLIDIQYFRIVVCSIGKGPYKGPMVKSFFVKFPHPHSHFLPSKKNLASKISSPHPLGGIPPYLFMLFEKTLLTSMSFPENKNLLFRFFLPSA